MGIDVVLPVLFFLLIGLLAAKSLWTMHRAKRAKTEDRRLREEIEYIEARARLERHFNRIFEWLGWKRKIERVDEETDKEIVQAAGEWLPGTPLPPAPSPTDRLLDIIRSVIFVVVMLAVLGLGLFVIASDNYDAETEKWAFGRGFWGPAPPS